MVVWLLGLGMVSLVSLVSVPDKLGRDTHGRVKHSFRVKFFDFLFVLVPLVLPEISPKIALAFHVIRTHTVRVEGIRGVTIKCL